MSAESLKCPLGILFFSVSFKVITFQVHIPLFPFILKTGNAHAVADECEGQVRGFWCGILF